MIRKSAGKVNRIIQGLEHQNGSDYYNFGFEFFGPFLYGYTKWLYQTVREQGLERVLFFARDGYMMQKAFDRLADGIDTEYVYFSRKSLRQALLCHADSFEESLKYYSWKRYVSIAEILDFYGFESNESKKIAAEKGLDLSKEFSFEMLPTAGELSGLYDDLKNEINMRSRVQSDLLLKYIDQIGLSERSAIVDIGWDGNMQYYLEEFLSINNLDPRLKGFYVGIDPVREIRGKQFGFLFSREDLSMKKSTLCFFGIYEKLFQSIEGSTNGYAEKDGIVEATKADYEYADDDTMIGVIKEMHIGAMDCFDSLCNMAEDNSIDLVEYAMPLLLYGEKPTLDQALLFRNMYNTDGIKTYFLPQKPLKQYKLKEFKRDLSNSSWKTGFLKAALKFPFPYDWIYKVMKK